MILFRISNDAFVLTAHVPRKRRAKAYLAKALELIEGDVTVWPIRSGYSASQVAQLMANRRVAQDILRDHVPRLMLKLDD